MKTENIKILFKKGRDSVTLDVSPKNKILETDVKAEVEHLNDEYFVEIPALNISLSAKEEKNIKQHIHDSVLSFFNYRLDKQGIDSFIITMFELGFEIKILSKKVKTRTHPEHKESQQVTEKFVLA